MQIPLRRHEKLKVRETGPIYLTEGGAERLKFKLERLEKSVPELVEEAARTAAFGDRSENAEYQAAKGILRRTYRQILSIKDQLKRVEIIKTGPNKSGKVQLGSTVVLETNGDRKTYQIVGPQETNPARERISFQSPLGAALIGHAQGEVVIIKTTTGERKYLILEVR